MSLIYHYCDIDALLSIIQSDKIRLSSLYSMNDTGEVEYFRAKALGGLADIIDKNYKYSEALPVYRAGISAPHYYGVCFSSEADDLYQWQSYGGKGKGVALGFDPAMLCSYKTPQMWVDKIGVIEAPYLGVKSQSLGLCGVRYSDAEDIERYVEVLRERALASAHKESENIAELIKITNMLSVTVKNKMFSAENEKRLLYAPLISHDLEGNIVFAEIIGQRLWRNGAYGMASYFEYPNINQAIREIVIGPACVGADPYRMRDFLLSQRMPSVKITESKATLR